MRALEGFWLLRVSGIGVSQGREHDNDHVHRQAKKVRRCRSIRKLLTLLVCTHDRSWVFFDVENQDHDVCL